MKVVGSEIKECRCFLTSVNSRGKNRTYIRVLNKDINKWTICNCYPWNGQDRCTIWVKSLMGMGVGRAESSAACWAFQFLWRTGERRVGGGISRI